MAEAARKGMVGKRNHGFPVQSECPWAWRRHSCGVFGPSAVPPVPHTTNSSQGLAEPVLPASCHHLRPRTELISCPKQVPAPEHSQSYWPWFWTVKMIHL